MKVKEITRVSLRSIKYIAEPRNKFIEVRLIKSLIWIKIMTLM